MAKLFAFFVLNEFSCFVSSNAISEAAWPLSSPFWYSRSTVVHLTAFEGFGISGVKGHQPWKNRSRLLAALSAELFTWKLSVKGISFLLPYLSSDTVFFFFQKRTTSPLTEKVSSACPVQASNPLLKWTLARGSHWFIFNHFVPCLGHPRNLLAGS